MNKLSILAAAALTAASFGAVAIAQDSSSDFAKYDANKDSLVSWDEALGAFPTLTEDLFKQADANADGSLDETEFASLQGLTAGAENAANTSSVADPAVTSSSSQANDGTSTPSSSAQ